MRHKYTNCNVLCERLNLVIIAQTLCLYILQLISRE